MIQRDGVTSDDQYGMELTLDLYGCDLTKISTGEHIKNFLIKLCDEVINMKRFGNPVVEHFGHGNPLTSGYSMVQLIETSCVSGHFSEAKKAAYINIFSCKWFDAQKTTDFCKTWFGAKRAKSRLIKRI